jgi:hypothetical protein
MALVYKHFLDILKVESQLNGEDEWDQRGFQALLPYCAAFQTAIADGDTSHSDRLKLLPKVLKCTSRLLSKLVSLVESKVNHEKLACVVVGSSSLLLSMVRSGGDVACREVQELLFDDQASVVMIFLHLLAVFEGVIQITGGESHREDEQLTEQCLGLYGLLLTSLFNTADGQDITSDSKSRFASHKLSQSFDGALGSQLVLCLLTLCKHRAKRVAGRAAAGLLLTMRCFAEHTSTWRACFPGTFSGLFVLTQGGFKR